MQEHREQAAWSSFFGPVFPFMSCSSSNAAALRTTCGSFSDFHGQVMTDNPGVHIRQLDFACGSPLRIARVVWKGRRVRRKCPDDSLNEYS
jgi:hypothetical protein